MPLLGTPDYLAKKKNKKEKLLSLPCVTFDVVRGRAAITCPIRTHTVYYIKKKSSFFFSFSHWLVAIIYCATSTIGFHTQGSSYSSDAFVRSAMILYSHIALYNVLLQYHLSECNRVCWLFFFFFVYGRQRGFVSIAFDSNCSKVLFWLAVFDLVHPECIHFCLFLFFSVYHSCTLMFLV